MITCNKCGETKSQEEYYRQPRNKSGYMGHCKVCEQARKNANNQKHKQADPEKWAARRRQYVKTYRQRHPDRVKEHDRKQSLLYKFGITIEQYDRMLEEQGGKCPCGAKPKNKRLAVDHDRACCSGNKSCGLCVRGLLCANCNTALGLLKENEETIASLLDYMRKYK